MTTVGAHWLADANRQFRKYKALADGALAQVADDDFFRTIDPESNSIALVVKHLSGNLRSRWTNFLAADGEKADRNRDAEFEREGLDTRESLAVRWEDGWVRLFDALAALTEDAVL